MHPARMALLALMMTASAAFQAGEPRGEDQAFVGSIQDLPLMPGLTEIEVGGLVFSTPDGRIVEAYARGPVEAQAVRAFYRDTLPQLGWRLAGGDAFAREGESLNLEFLDGGEGLTLRFVLKPE